MRVLIVKTSSMGDILHTLPALTDAIECCPDIRFDWVVEENFAEIPRWHHAVEQVIPVAIRRWRKHWFRHDVRRERHNFHTTLTAQHYDAIIDAQGLMKSAFLVTRLGHGTKHGLNWHSAREPLASLFYQVKHHISKNQHAIERIRQLFANSLGYSVPDHQGHYDIATHFLTQPAPFLTPYLVFLHATTRENKHWPESHWRSLIEKLNPLGIAIYLPWGSEAEHQRALRLAEQQPHVTVLPKSNLGQVANILAHANGIVSVDTGLSHLAAALDKPNITLYGPTDAGLIGGYGKGQLPITSSTHTMADIQPDTIFNLLLDEQFI